MTKLKLEMIKVFSSARFNKMQILISDIKNPSNVIYLHLQCKVDSVTKLQRQQ